MPEPRPASLTLSIDGRAVTVPAGATVLDAARAGGADIPTLCDHPLLKPAGACRLCVVEIEGMRGLPTACTTPAAEGMAVRTDAPAVRDLRRETLSLILSEHPYTCLVCGRHERCAEWQTTIRKAAVTTGCENCPKNGQCELQAIVEKVGLEEIPFPIHYRGLPVEKDDPFFDRDYNLCILCGRCVRVCQDLRQTGTLAFVQRGPNALVGTAFGKSHLESDCEFCGACVDVCPTGALYDKRTKWEGPAETKAVAVCPYCSVGCSLEIGLKRGKVISVRPAEGGQLCVRGRFGIVEMVHAQDRLTTPLVRRGGQLVAADWDAALACAAEKLAPYRGNGGFALLGSPHLTTESAHVLQKFAREVMGTRAADCAGALPPNSGAMLARLRDLPRATVDSIRAAKAILVIGTNPRLSHPVVALRIRQALRLGGAKLVVIDPRETEMARRADVWIRPAPGGDAEILAALAKGKSEDGAVAEAARLLRENAPAAIVFGSGVTHNPEAPITLDAIRKLAEASGAGILPLTGASNFEAVAASGLVAGEGDTGYAEIAAGIESGAIRALYVAGEVPPLPGIAKLDVLIVQDFVATPFLEDKAEVVFPAAAFLEEAGTRTNMEGKELAFPAVLPPPGDALPDWRIVARLAQKMGAQDFDYPDLAAVRVASGAARTAAPAVKSTGRKPAPPAGEFTLILERNAFAYRNFSLTERIRGMAEVKSDEGFLVLHPQDAAQLAVAAEDQVRVTSAAGSDTFPVLLRADGPAGIVFASIHPLAGSPILPGMAATEKRIAVRLEKAP